MSDTHLIDVEVEYITSAIAAIRSAAGVHNMQEDNYDPDWSDNLDLMVHRLLARKNDLLTKR